MSTHHQPFTAGHATIADGASRRSARVQPIPVCACGQDLLGNGKYCPRCGVTLRRVSHVGTA